MTTQTTNPQAEIAEAQRQIRPGLLNMHATQASIPIMGLRIGKRFKGKKKVFIFSF